MLSKLPREYLVSDPFLSDVTFGEEDSATGGREVHFKKKKMTEALTSGIYPNLAIIAEQLGGCSICSKSTLPLFARRKSLCHRFSPAGISVHRKQEATNEQKVWMTRYKT